MRENQRRIGARYATKPDALRYATDGCGFHCCNAAGNDVILRVPEWNGMNATGAQKEQRNGGSATEENEARRFYWRSCGVSPFTCCQQAGFIYNAHRVCCPGEPVTIFFATKTMNDKGRMIQKDFFQTMWQCFLLSEYEVLYL
ncbi:MAG: hypothetical protein ABI619_06335 [Betaproteobacteria bacterium]